MFDACCLMVGVRLLLFIGTVGVAAVVVCCVSCDVWHLWSDVRCLFV